METTKGGKSRSPMLGKFGGGVKTQKKKGDKSLMIIPKANHKETSLHEMTLVIADSGYVVTAYLTEEVRHKMKTN